MIESFDGKTPRIAESAFVHPSATIIGDVEIGENTIVWPGAVLRGDFGGIRIGRNTFIEDNCVLHAGNVRSMPTGVLSLPDTYDEGCMEIGDNVTIGHGAVVNCKKIGNSVLIGINASALHNAEIEDQCIIAAGAVVPANARIPSRSFVAGVPGVIKGEATEEQLAWVPNRDSYIGKLVQKVRGQEVLG